MYDILTRQKEFFNEGRTLGESFRREQLRKLHDAVKNSEEEIYLAVRKDLNKSRFECYAAETGFVLSEISYFLKNLHSLMKPQRARTPLMNFPSKGRIEAEPLGSVLIISPWNYPFQLAMAPLAGCIAAGDCAVLKLSEDAPATAELVEDMIEDLFPPEYVAVARCERGREGDLAAEPFDHIFYTGSPAAGRKVMRRAADNLTPVTLELGGKSPCIVDETADIPLAARRIVWGKLMNAGQTCVAPDYIAVHGSVSEKLISEMKKNIEISYGSDILRNDDYPKIINSRHFMRLTDLIKRSDIIAGGASDPGALKIEPAIVRGTWDCPAMEDEIFGPVLPVIEYGDIGEVTDHIRKRSRPLALYLFTSSGEMKERITGEVSFGGGCINDTIIHLASSTMPFGGVGGSGMGSYHGRYSFETFSHRKTVVEKGRLDIPVRYAPAGKRDLKIVKKLMR